MASKKFICKFFNKETGCNKESGDCIGRHEQACSNKLCAKIGVDYTHTFAECGRPSGPKHAEYLLSKNKPLPKEPKKLLNDTRIMMLELIYLQVEERLSDKEELEKEYGVLPTVGKIVGMFDQALPFEELAKLATDPTALSDRVIDALETYKAAQTA